MVDETLLLGVVSAVVPVAVAGLGYSWKTARRSGALEQKVKDLSKMIEDERADEVVSIKDLGRKLGDTDAKVVSVKLDVATIKTDIAWIKDAIRNGKAK